MDAFSELCIKYRTPKVKLPWNELSHDYAPHYNALFEGRTIRRILEIGCGPAKLFHDEYPAGGSLLVWAELFPEAKICGIDMDITTFPSHQRIRCFLCDQSKRGELEAFARDREPFDLIIDDGSHKTADQLLTAEIFVPLLSPDGVYVIEDVIPPGELSKQLPFPHREIECSRASTMGDDRLIVIEARNLEHPKT